MQNIFRYVKVAIKRLYKRSHICRVNAINIIVIFIPFVCLSQNSIHPTNKIVKQRWILDRTEWTNAHYKIDTNDKPEINFDAIDNWPALGEYRSLSSDGKYFAYDIVKGAGLPYPNSKSDSLIIQSTNNNWRQAFKTITPGVFSADSKKYIFLNKETLYSLSLGDNEAIVVNDVRSFKLTGKVDTEWLAYQLKNVKSTVVLETLSSRKQKQFDSISDFTFDKSGRWFICESNVGSKNLLLYDLQTERSFQFSSVDEYSIDDGGKSLLIKGKQGSLSFIDLEANKTLTIWQPTTASESITSFNQNAINSQVAFTVQDKENGVSVWYYRAGMDKAVMKVNGKSPEIASDFLIQSFVSFTDAGHYILLSLGAKPEKRQAVADAVRVDIWSYKDTILQSTQANLLKEQRSFTAIFNLDNDQMIQLENSGKKLYSLQGDYALVKKTSSETYGDRFWEEGYGYNNDSNWLVSLRDGSRKLLPTRSGLYTLFFSPGGRYLVYYDNANKGHYFSYELETGILKDLSTGVPDWQFGNQNAFVRQDDKPTLPSGVAAWIENDKGILVYDTHDIWQLDLEGKKPPINISNGYGRSHDILFILSNNDRLSADSRAVVSSKGLLILESFNWKTKYNGFYRKNIGISGDPELLYMGPCFFKSGTHLSGFAKGMEPLKAANSNTWIIQKQTATEAPNYFLTADFKNFKQLSNLQPQKKYNWLKTELVSFKQLDGTTTQGILYKPENFDSKKKYPVIINFYAQFTAQLNQFPIPSYMDRPSFFDRPAWLVSHGYLVLVPDLYFIKGNWGRSALNTVGGANNYLKRLPFVDSLCIGVSGHSNSGRFSYYLATHTKSFAAMAIGAGTTDVVSMSLGLTKDGQSNLNWGEVSAFGAGGLGNIWENKKKWIDHNAVIEADKVVSPLLIFHNKKDGVPVGQAIELYTSLRRLEKKVWWLQYDNGGHILSEIEDLRDFTIRYAQYFDHYLKCAPAPRWMCEGIPFKDKGIESKYELDPSGTCDLPNKKECPICAAWNKQYKRNPAMFEKPIAELKLDKDIEAEMNKKETERYRKNMIGEAQRIKENNDKLKGVWKGERY